MLFDRSREDVGAHPPANDHILTTRDYSPSMWSQQGNYGGGLNTGGSITAKQHYLTRSRYIAGQSTKLPLRNSNANPVSYGTNIVGESQHFIRSCYIAGQSTKLLLRNSNANPVSYGTINVGESQHFIRSCYIAG